VTDSGVIGGAIFVGSVAMWILAGRAARRGA